MAAVSEDFEIKYGDMILRLLVFTQYFWPENFRINELAQSLTSSGLEVSVLTGKPNYPEGRVFSGYRAIGIQEENYGGVAIVRVPILPRGTKSAVRLLLNYLSFVFSGYLVAPFALRGRKFDAVLVYAPSPLVQALPAIFLAWLKKAPLLVWVQDLWPESLSATGYVNNYFALRAVEVMVGHIYHRADKILISSEAFREPIMRLVRNTDKIHYYPNSAERIFNTTDPQANQEQLVADIKNSFSIVFAGNIGKAQAMPTILDAATQLASKAGIRFFLIGSGSELSWVKGEVERRKLRNVVIAGRLPITDLPAILGAASALLVTLKDETIFSYTIPGKIQSYLAVGRPIIASLNGEGARIVDEAKAGISCPSEDADALSQGIFLLSEMSETQRNRMGENGRAYFQDHFDQDKLVNDLIGHLQEVISVQESRP